MIVQPVLIRIPFEPELSIPRRVQRQREFARMALDHCARLCQAPRGEWPMTADRVPLSRDGYHWSIAHKPRFAAAVIARQPVGIDIEAMVPRNRDLSPAVATPEEWRMATRGRDCEFRIRKDSDWRVFFAVWTAKEATLKANSTGISGLNVCKITGIDAKGRMSLDYQGNLFSVEHFLYANHIAAVTCAGPSIQWHVFEPTASQTDEPSRRAQASSI